MPILFLWVWGLFRWKKRSTEELSTSLQCRMDAWKQLNNLFFSCKQSSSSALLRLSLSISAKTLGVATPAGPLAVKNYFFCANSGVNKSARERRGRQNLSQNVPSKKGSLGVIFSPRNQRENAHSKSANFDGRHSGGHLLGRPLLFTSDSFWPVKNF